MQLNPGQILNNRYRIVKLLGQGGFGAVYRAWDTNMNGLVAVKECLDTSLAAQKQFQIEAQLLFKLRQPNLPVVHDTFILPGQGLYLIMDFIEGEDLQGRLERNGGPLPEAQTVAWIAQVCDALSYLHNQIPPVIHRDIKPANIRITPEGRAMLVDFGISKVYDPALATTLGARAVTPGFSPPEQYGTGATDARSDVYALGATLYTLLTGQAPVESIQLSIGIPLAGPRSLNPRLSPQIAAAIQGAMQLRPDERFANTAELKAALLSQQGGAATWVQPQNTVVMSTPVMAAAPAWPNTLSRGPTSRNLVSPPRLRVSSRILMGMIAILVLVAVILTLFAGIYLSRQASPTGGAYSELAATWTALAAGQLQVQSTQTALVGEAATRERATQTALAIEVAARERDAQATQTALANEAATRERDLHSTQTAVIAEQERATATTFVSQLILLSQDDFNRPDEVLGDDETFFHAIQNGVDYWKYKQSNCTAWWFWDGNNLTPHTFLLSMDVRIIEGNPEAEISIQFRRIAEHSHYLYSIRNNQYRLLRYNASPNGDSQEIFTDWTSSSAIRPGDWNHLEVRGEGSHFEIYANGQWIDQFQDSALPNGVAGIHLYACQQGIPTVFAFDNFLLFTNPVP